MSMFVNLWLDYICPNLPVPRNHPGDHSEAVLKFGYDIIPDIFSEKILIGNIYFLRNASKFWGYPIKSQILYVPLQKKTSEPLTLTLKAFVIHFHSDLFLVYSILVYSISTKIKSNKYLFRLSGLLAYYYLFT